MQRNQNIQAIIDNFSQFKRLLHSHYYGSFVALKLSPAQMELLSMIRQNEPISHKALAAKLQLTPGAVTQLLDGLDKLDCITRTPSPSDRRVSYVAVSRAGKHKLDEVRELRKRLFTNAFDTLTDDELLSYYQAQQKLIDWLEANQPTHT